MGGDYSKVLDPLTKQPSKILVRGVNWLGDAVMTTPALQRLRERFPGSHITLSTAENLEPLWTHHPSLDATLSFSRTENALTIARRLRAENFDLALILPNSPRSALETWLARIPQRVGYARPWRNWFLTQAIPARAHHVPTRKRSVREIHRLVESQPGPTESRDIAQPGPTPSDSSSHHLHEYLQLVAALGGNSDPVPPLLNITTSELEAAAQKFGLSTGAGRKSSGSIFGINAGAEYGPAKRWPSERFIAAAVEVERRTQCRWVIFGGPADVNLATEIGEGIKRGLGRPSQACEPLSVAGKTSIRELCALLKLCDLLLTNDTGPMHVAAAVGTPVIVPFGSTSPELTGPGLPGDTRHHLLKSNAPCSPCFLRECPIDFRCMSGISVERVVDIVLRVANSNRSVV
jgi:heptosyltransferase-2